LGDPLQTEKAWSPDYVVQGTFISTLPSKLEVERVTKVGDLVFFRVGVETKG